MNKKVTDIHRMDLEEINEVKMSDEQWDLFCDVLHQKIVPTLWEDIMYNN